MKGLIWQKKRKEKNDSKESNKASTSFLEDLIKILMYSEKANYALNGKVNYEDEIPFRNLCWRLDIIEELGWHFWKVADEKIPLFSST